MQDIGLPCDGRNMRSAGMIRVELVVPSFNHSCDVILERTAAEAHFDQPETGFGSLLVSHHWGGRLPSRMLCQSVWIVYTQLTCRQMD